MIAKTTVYCERDEWKVGMPQITQAQLLSWNHGAEYRGPIFHFCPWCGAELEEE